MGLQLISKITAKIESSKNCGAESILFLVPPNITFDDFVNPPANISTIQKNGRQFGSVITDMPLGIISLSAYLKMHTGIKTYAIDFNVELNKDDEFKSSSFESYFRGKLVEWKKGGGDVHYVCISALFTPAYHSIIDLSCLAKDVFRNSIVLVGGNFPSAMHRDILNDCQAIDAVCYGEGEIPMLEYLNACNKKIYLDNSSSWVTHNSLAKKDFYPEKNLIWNLDEIPFLDYDLLDIEGYKLNPTVGRYSVKEQADHENVDSNDDNLQIGKIGFSMPVMTSRGCPFKCTFCASHVGHGYDMRYHSLERVLSDIQKMVVKFKIDSVTIQDDHFMAGKDRPYQIVDSIGRLHLGMFFQNALAIYALKADFLKLLKTSGVNALVLPIESGSARVLKELMRKPLKLDIVPEVMRNCRNAGIYTDCNIILGMPGETIEDIDDARKFLKTIYADWFRVFVATPIPGSDMYKTCVANDLFEVTPLKANYKRAVVKTGSLSPGDIQRQTYLMNIELNFIHNSNMRLGNYDMAIHSFQSVLNVKPDHAFAHYYIAQAYNKIGLTEKFTEHNNLAVRYMEGSEFWQAIATHFEVDLCTPA